MDTDRLEAVGSPLIEDFLDCDQLGSDSEFDTSRSASPTRTLKRLHIHVDMTCNEYLAPGPHHPERAQIDGLPSCSNISQPGVYSSTELDPFSAVSGVSSFNYPAAADPSLLTPASSAGSPPLQHRQSSVKPGPNFSQAPTPPDSSKMYGYNAFDVGPGSQSASPMTIHPSVTEAGAFDMASYMAHSPPVSHHPSSPKSEVPPQIDPYLGHFTVSGGNDGEVTHHSLQEYHPYGVTVAPSGTYISQHVPVGTPHMQHRMPSTGTPPLLSQPHPPQYRHPTPQAGVVEDLRDPGMFLGPFTPHGTLSSGRRQPPRKKPSSSRKPSRTPKTAAHRSADANAQFAQDDDGDELVLGEDAPEEDKYLFQLRKEFISEKGKGMWEEMKTKFTERHQGNWEKAALQMKVSRAVARHGVWPEREIDRLREAFAYFEEMRYNMIIARMKENGGCRVWDWKRAHIESMLVKLGMEELVPNEKTGSRRLRKKVARRQASPHPVVAPVMPGDWPSNGLGLHHGGFHHHAHHVAAGAAARQGQAYDNLMADGFPSPPHLTPIQQDDLIDQVFSTVKVERSLSPDDGMEGLSYDGSSHDAGGGSRRPSTVASHELNHQGSARLARQACQRLQPPHPHGPENPYGTR